MSWLKNAVTKVGEKAEAIKHSERFQRLQERTSVVVASAAEGVKRAREKIGRPANAIEFEAQLESRAKSTRTLAGIVEMHKSWVQSISAGKEGAPRVVSGDHELGFKEMFLQSRALEYSMEVIVSEPSLREQYMDPPNPDDKTSAIACLYELFSKTLAFPASQWQGLLRVAMTGGLPGEEQAAWLTTAITAMKADWSEEVLYTERKELALRAEFLKQELKQLEATDAEEATKKRIDTSAQLLRTYDAVRQNLQTSQAQRDEVRHLREQELLALQQQIQARMVGLQSFADSCTSQQRDLEGELNQSQDSIKLQLQHMDEVRAGIDKEIDELDERKRQLRIELDTVSRQLDEARMKQKQHMESCDRQRAEFYNTKAALKEKLDAANTDGAAKAKEKELLDQTRQLIEETGLALQRTVREQTEELKQKQAEFQSHFKLLLLDHLRYAEGRAKDLQAEAQKAVASQDPGAKEAARAAAQGAADALDELCKDIDFVGDSGVKAQLENLRVAHGATLALLGAPASAASAPATAAATLSPPAEAAYPSESAAHSSQQVPII